MVVRLTLDVLSVGVGKTGGTIAMASHPPVKAVVVLALRQALNVGVKIRAISEVSTWHSGPGDEQRAERDANALQNGAIVPVTLRLALEARATLAQQAPVLLEDAEVGAVLLLVVAVGVVGCHVLALEHGDRKIEGVGAGRGDLLLARSESGDSVGAAVLTSFKLGGW